jgi:hypothetical protein
MLTWLRRIRSEGLSRRTKTSVVAAAVVVTLGGLVMPAIAVTGNVGGSGIEIDAPNTANLYPGNASKNCTSANFGGSIIDWVKDCDANTDTPSLTQSVATGLIPNVTSRPGGSGHWNGVRIVDGVGSDEADIFLTGGKEDDLSTWNVGSGTVGSSKYDATQAYLANNQTDLFFGMERRGNNGTTAFDFEFNQNAPANNSNYLPTRTVNDVLLTFELNGSGGSGSATAHYFRWNGSAYIEQNSLPAGTVASINDSTNTPGAPWGHVDSKGNWVDGNLDRFGFGEAKVPLSILPGVNACGGAAYVQLRTRSSATSTSDLKDTTKIFKYEFPSIDASASKTSADGSAQTVTLTGSASGVSSPSFQWQRLTSSGWQNIAGATSSTLTYSTFEADDFDGTSPSGAFSIGTDNYVGKVYAVDLRVRAYKTVGSQTCQDFSDAVTVKKVLAVDP